MAYHSINNTLSIQEALEGDPTTRDQSNPTLARPRHSIADVLEVVSNGYRGIYGALDVLDDPDRTLKVASRKTCIMVFTGGLFVKDLHSVKGYADNLEKIDKKLRKMPSGTRYALLMVNPGDTQVLSLLGESRSLNSKGQMAYGIQYLPQYRNIGFITDMSILWNSDRSVSTLFVPEHVSIGAVHRINTMIDSSTVMITEHPPREAHELTEGSSIPKESLLISQFAEAWSPKLILHHGLSTKEHFLVSGNSSIISLKKGRGVYRMFRLTPETANSVPNTPDGYRIDTTLYNITEERADTLRKKFAKRYNYCSNCLKRTHLNHHSGQVYCGPKCQYDAQRKKPRAATDRVVKKMVAKFDAGITKKQIAKEHNLDHNTVARYIKWYKEKHEASDVAPDE